MDIGQPKRIIEIEPVTLPVPGEVLPEAEPAEPAERPDREPAPVAPDQSTP